MLKANVDKLVQLQLAAFDGDSEDENQLTENFREIKEVIEKAYFSNCILVSQFLVQFSQKFGPSSQY